MNENGFGALGLRVRPPNEAAPGPVVKVHDLGFLTPGAHARQGGGRVQGLGGLIGKGRLYRRMKLRASRDGKISGAGLQLRLPSHSA